MERSRSVPGLRNKVRWARFEFLISALMNIMYSGMSRHQRGHSTFLFSVRESVGNTLCCNRMDLNVRIAAPAYDGRTDIPSYSIEFLLVTLHYRIRHSEMTVGMQGLHFRVLMISSCFLEVINKITKHRVVTCPSRDWNSVPQERCAICSNSLCS